MNMIEVPFNKRIVLVGGDYPDRDSVKSAMKNFRFTTDPGELEQEYRKMLQLSKHTGFGCVNYDSIKIDARNEHIWKANWIAGGSLDPRLYTEIIDGYYVRGGRMTNMYINTGYYGFMLGTGEWLFDSVDLFGNEEEYSYLQSHSTYKQISDIFMDRLHKAYESITAMDYTELDDILL